MASNPATPKAPRPRIDSINLDSERQDDETLMLASDAVAERYFKMRLAYADYIRKREETSVVAVIAYAATLAIMFSAICLLAGALKLIPAVVGVCVAASVIIIIGNLLGFKRVGR